MVFSIPKSNVHGYERRIPSIETVRPRSRTIVAQVARSWISDYMNIRPDRRSEVPLEWVDKTI